MNSNETFNLNLDNLFEFSLLKKCLDLLFRRQNDMIFAIYGENNSEINENDVEYMSDNKDINLSSNNKNTLTPQNIQSNQTPTKFISSQNGLVNSTLNALNKT